ncbi:MAG TPA: universal stress protein [Acidimicrobiia bacterium]|nr:universal stress protein [Acidimicrobiia bacterium]
MTVHILIATAGVLPTSPVADLIRQFLPEGGQVSVVTVIEVPRSFLDGLESDSWHPFSEDTERSDRASALVERYVEERGRKLAEPVMAALGSRGIEANPIFVEGTDRAAAICETAEQVEADLILMGATRRLFGEGAWESISGQVMQRTHLPLLLVSGAPRPAEERDSEDPTIGAHETSDA